MLVACTTRNVARYRWGGRYGSPYNLTDVTHFDMWSDYAPAKNDIIDEISYSTNFYAQQAIEALRNRNTSRPTWLHVAFQVCIKSSL